MNHCIAAYIVSVPLYISVRMPKCLTVACCFFTSNPFLPLCRTAVLLPLPLPLLLLMPLPLLLLMPLPLLPLLPLMLLLLLLPDGSARRSPWAVSGRVPLCGLPWPACYPARCAGHGRGEEGGADGMRMGSTVALCCFFFVVWCLMSICSLLLAIRCALWVWMWMWHQ